MEENTPIPVAALHLKAGDTVLLPSGWIHAVYTPKDSLVFGGNFLTQFSIPLQLHVYHMEIVQETEQRFLFPAFEKLHWYAADVILGKLTNYLYASQEPPPYLLKAANALINPLQQWLENRKDLPKGERNNYLPARTYLQYAYPTLIAKLEEMIHSFISRSPSYCHSSSAKKPRKSKHQQRIPSGDEEEEDHVESDSTDPLVGESEDYSGAHARSPLPKSSQGRRFSREDSQSSCEEDVEDDESLREVLDAVPELKSSKLIGDEYVFSLTESMDEGVKKRKCRKASSKNSQKSDDPDPTWTAVSSSTLARRRRSNSSSRRPSHPPFSHSYNVSRPVSTHYSLTSPSLPGGTSIQNSSSARRGKSSKTVRQRLAKRLGL
nr:Lysine specific demethylase 7A [Hymenolepis microstoma]